MYKVVWAMLACLAFALPAKANEDAQQVISSQIEAFLQNDVTTAFEYASPTIQQVFRTPERFGAMVQQGYPMVWRPADVMFLSAKTEDGELLQDVLIEDQSGALYILEYRMVETEVGWLINGVRLRAEEENLASLQLPF